LPAGGGSYASATSLSLLHGGPSSDALPPRLLNDDDNDDDNNEDDNDNDNDRWSSWLRSQQCREEQSFRIARRRQILRVRHLLVTAVRRPVIRAPPPWLVTDDNNDDDDDDGWSSRQ
jgi:hypothetical protein